MHYKAVTMATPFSPLALSPIPNPNSSQLFLSQFSFRPILTKSAIPKPYHPNSPNSTSPISWRRRSSTNPLSLLSEAASIDNSQEIVPPSDEVSAKVVSGLLLVAFVGLSFLTVGVIYIAVTDFLRKREREKFEKEEAAVAGKKKRGRKGVAAASRGRSGPRGFGQKVEEDGGVDEAE